VVFVDWLPRAASKAALGFLLPEKNIMPRFKLPVNLHEVQSFNFLIVTYSIIAL
jgi:hypothetical protein